MKTHSSSSKTSNPVKQINPQQSKELKTEGPLSEKDEVKKAEERTRKAIKHHG